MVGQRPLTLVSIAIMGSINKRLIFIIFFLYYYPRCKANHHIFFCLWQFLSLLISSLQLNKVSQQNKVSFVYISALFIFKHTKSGWFRFEHVGVHSHTIIIRLQFTKFEHCISSVMVNADASNLGNRKFDSQCGCSRVHAPHELLAV